MVVLTIVDHLGPARLPTVPRPPLNEAASICPLEGSSLPTQLSAAPHCYAWRIRFSKICKEPNSHMQGKNLNKHLAKYGPSRSPPNKGKWEVRHFLAMFLFSCCLTYGAVGVPKRRPQKAAQIRTCSTTTRDRNLQFRGAVSTGFLCGFFPFSPRHLCNVQFVEKSLHNVD